MLYLIKIIKNPVFLIVALVLSSYAYGRLQERNSCKIELLMEQSKSIEKIKEIEIEQKKREEELYKQFKNKTYANLKEFIKDYNEVITQ